MDLAPPASPQGRKLLTQVRLAVRTRHMSPRTERQYVHWVKRFVLFHGKRHPLELGEAEISAFLSDLADRGRVSASTQTQALAAVLFLYRRVLRRPLPWLKDIARAKRAQRVPVVLTRDEVRSLLGALDGVPRLVATLPYDGGLRLMEAVRLRVHDLDFGRGELTVRAGKGNKDRVTVLAQAAREPLKAHLEEVRRQWMADVAGSADVADRAGPGRVRVRLPDAVARKYPSAEREWGWWWVFPAGRPHADRAGQRWRHYLHPTVIQRAVREGVRRAGLVKRASCHTLRHYADCRIMPTAGSRSSNQQSFSRSSPSRPIVNAA